MLPVRVLRPHIAGLSARPVLQLPATGASVAPLPRAARRGEGRAGGGRVGGWGDGTFSLSLGSGREVSLSKVSRVSKVSKVSREGSGREEARERLQRRRFSLSPSSIIGFECIPFARGSSLGRTVVCAADVRGTPWRSASTTFRAPTWLAFTATYAARKVRFLFVFGFGSWFWFCSCFDCFLLACRRDGTALIHLSRIYIRRLGVHTIAMARRAPTRLTPHVYATVIIHPPVQFFFLKMVSRLVNLLRPRSHVLRRAGRSSCLRGRAEDQLLPMRRRGEAARVRTELAPTACWTFFLHTKQLAVCNAR